MAEPTDAADTAVQEPAKVPWRKNLLWLFGLAYTVTGALYACDVWAQGEIEGYVSQAAALIEVFKVLAIGTIAVAKDMIR